MRASRGLGLQRIICLGIPAGAGLGLFTAPAAANTLHVPAQYATIQYALIVAAPGDTVLVAPGTYYEKIVWPARQSLHLISETGPDATVIHGMDVGTVIRFSAPVDSTTLIEGFTITHGTGEMGGGIACVSAEPTIRGNRIVENVATYYGGGIYCEGQSRAPIITGNSFCANTVIDGSGGAICSYGDTYPVISDNEFRDNTADAYYGGAIHCEAYSLQARVLLIAHNTFRNNSAGGGGALSFFNPYSEPPKVLDNEIVGNHAVFGGGIYSFWSLAHVRGNAIRDNHATGTGGGIFAEESHDLAVIDCEISGNVAGALGGGLGLVHWTTTPVVAGNVITRNRAGDGGGIGCYYMSSPTIRENQITENVATGRGGGIFCELECVPPISLNVVMNNRAAIGGGVYMLASQPTITECALAQNDAGGVHFAAGWAGHTPQVHENSIAGNAGYGMRNDGATVPVAAENNWWGDPTGPFHPVQNPGGLGDPVGDHVLFTPWLLDPAPVAAVEEPGGGQGPRPGGAAGSGTIATSGAHLACAPNPFERATTITLSVPGGLEPAGAARIAIYDVTGRLVRSFPVLASRAAGAGLEARVDWEGDDDHGAPLPAGVHYIRVEAGAFRLMARVIRLR